MEVEILGEKRIVGKRCKCEQEEYEKRQRLQESKEKQQRLDKLRAYSLMDKKFENCTFENFEINDKNKKMYKIGISYCKRWHEMKARNIGLLFYGGVGIGKTFLSFCVANKLLKNYITVIAISSIGVINRIYESYKKFGSEGEQQIINQLKNAELLIIDDLGAEYKTDKSKQLIYSIVDSRYRDQKPLIITTNLSLGNLKKHLKIDEIDRTYDRIIEMCIPVEFEGKSRRVDTNKEKTEILKSLLKG